MTRFIPWRELAISGAIAFTLIAFSAGRAIWHNGGGVGSLAGWALMLIGLLISIPGAIVYHLRLARFLGARGELDAGWIWHPSRLHHKLRAEERRPVLGWFALGAVGWLITIAGCAWVGLSLF